MIVEENSEMSSYNWIFLFSFIELARVQQLVYMYMCTKIHLLNTYYIKINTGEGVAFVKRNVALQIF